MRIVVVEDNISVAKGICYHLQDAGHAVDMIHDGAQADAFLRDDGSDLIVLDINLPNIDGLSILRGMRGRGDQRPVLMLTARADTHDKVAGLDAGADDYLVKPFEMVEFSARIRSLPRRVSDQKTPTRMIGPLHFDLASRMVSGPDGPLDVPRREVALFERLLMAEGRLVSKQSLLDSLYGPVRMWTNLWSRFTCRGCASGCHATASPSRSSAAWETICRRRYDQIPVAARAVDHCHTCALAGACGGVWRMGLLRRAIARSRAV